jgi:ATP-dependent DNA ligase
MHANPRTWRPQAFGRRRFSDVSDPVIEPAWEGVRVLAHLDAATAWAAIHDETGEDLTEDHAPIVDALLEALAANTAILDGYLTDQATRNVKGRATLAGDNPTIAEHAGQFFLGRQGAELMSGRSRHARTGSQRTRAEVEWALEDSPIAFVAIDMVELDGEPLVGIPLLERKRLLESVLEEGDLVRRTPFVREPAGTFIITWRALGFDGLAYKAANSRYLPGAPNDEWCLAPMPRR